jgi:hypothetical protein
MKVKDLFNTAEVTDLKEAYLQSSTYSKMGGQCKHRASWLIAYYQLKVLKGYKPDEVKVYERINLKHKNSQLEFDSNWNDPTARNLNFIGAGNMSKGASNKRARMNNRLFKSAEESCRMKLIHKIVEFVGDGMTDNNLRQAIIMDISTNKDIVDTHDYSYWYQWNTPLIEIHADILLWSDRYAPKYATDLIGYHIGKYWVRTTKLLN